MSLKTEAEQQNNPREFFIDKEKHTCTLHFHYPHHYTCILKSLKNRILFYYSVKQFVLKILSME